MYAFQRQKIMQETEFGKLKSLYGCVPKFTASIENLFISRAIDFQYTNSKFLKSLLTSIMFGAPVSP